MAGEDEARGGWWWADEPITSPAEDELGRGPFVAQIGQLLEQIRASSSSTVLGLVGPWGSGKTSTVNLVIDGLDRQLWGVAEVNPWALSGPDAVIAELLAGVSAALPAKDRTARRARRALTRYGAFAAPLLSLVPLVGSAAKDVGQAALARLAGEGTLQQRAQEVIAELTRLARPVLVVIDDVDRLQPEELLALFKAVRVLGRLPHVHYLLAYDEHTVLDVLRVTPVAAGDVDRALAFLEKVVTLRLDQPPTLPAQTGQLFDQGLAGVLVDLGVTITDDQRRRLADEREALLVPTLTEPRSVARFLAQLRAYLPLVGPGEIDLVDFTVLTLLRVTQPRLYRALGADRAVLIGGDSDDLGSASKVDATRLAAWGDPSRLDQLGVAEPDQARVRAALHRLFPLMGREKTAVDVLDRPLRRQDRRVSDPDHVERYFALVPVANDVPDVVLLAALDEWTHGQPGTAAEQVIAVLRPTQPDAKARELAARVLRRAAARTLTCSASQAATLLPVVLKLLPLPAAAGIGSGPEDAAVAWLAQLLGQADAPPADDLRMLVDQPAHVDSPLWSLVRALRLADPQRQPGDWLSSVTDVCLELAWQRFLGHCRLGDSAPMEPAGGLLRWMEEQQGPAEVNRRLRAEVDDGLPVADLAARLVEAVILATGQGTLIGFDPDGFVRRLGFDRLRAHRPALVGYKDGDSAAGIDENDVSWANRQRFATDRLLAALDIADQLAARLPILAPVQNNPLLNHGPTLYTAPTGQEPDLQVRVSVLIPNGSLPRFDPAPGPAAHEREQAILNLLQASPVTSWLTDAAPGWHVKAEAWKITESDGQMSTTATSETRPEPDAVNESRPGGPIALAAQVRTGRAPSPSGSDAHEPAVLLTVAMMIWLGELTADRRPDEQRHTGEPLPAALSLPEVYSLLAALTRCATTAQSALTSLTEARDVPGEILIDLEMETRPGIGAVIDLSKISHVRTAQRTQFRQTFTSLTAPLDDETPSYTPALDDITVRTLHDWLMQAGYRDYDQPLRDLWRPPAAATEAATSAGA